MLTRPNACARTPARTHSRRLAAALLALAAFTLSGPAVGQDGWAERRIAAIDARLLVHGKLRAIPVRPAKTRFRTVARWRWPHAKTIYVSIETAPLAAGTPLTALLEEMDGKPRREPRADGLPAIRTELIFEGTLERRFWIHDRARGRVVRLSIAILGVDRWMQRTPADVRKEFADPLWVPTKMFRSIRFDPT
jgi:hypothetical protein